MLDKQSIGALCGLLLLAGALLTPMLACRFGITDFENVPGLAVAAVIGAVPGAALWYTLTKRRSR